MCLCCTTVASIFVALLVSSIYPSLSSPVPPNSIDLLVLSAQARTGHFKFAAKLLKIWKMAAARKKSGTTQNRSFSFSDK